MVVDNKYSIVRILIIAIALIGLTTLIVLGQILPKNEAVISTPTAPTEEAPITLLNGDAADPTQVDPELQQVLSMRETFISDINATYPINGLQRNLFLVDPEGEVGAPSQPTPPPVTDGKPVRISYEEYIYLTDPADLTELQEYTTLYYSNLGYGLDGAPYVAENGETQIFYLKTNEDGTLERVNVTLNPPSTGDPNLYITYNSTKTYSITKVPSVFESTDKAELDSLKASGCVNVSNPYYTPYWDARYNCL